MREFGVYLGFREQDLGSRFHLGLREKGLGMSLAFLNPRCPFCEHSEANFMDRPRVAFVSSFTSTTPPPLQG